MRKGMGTAGAGKKQFGGACQWQAPPILAPFSLIRAADSRSYRDMAGVGRELRVACRLFGGLALDITTGPLVVLVDVTYSPGAKVGWPCAWWCG